MQDLPIDAALPELIARLGRDRAAVLTAAPGAGKSTRVPPALLDPRLLHPDHPRVICLQPRRVAAASLARRVAAERGWRLGDQVGYRVRFESVGTPATRLWFETEGTLTRQLLRDPYLDGVGAVVLDEFHERSWHADLALAWLAELRRTLRPDLIVVVMSATMAAGPVADFLHTAPLAVPGSLHPVGVQHRPAKPQERLPDQVARVVREVLAAEAGDVLVFLPGVGEITACSDLLRNAVDAAVMPLHGSLSPDDQDRALQLGPRRRVVLATNVAETSVTVDGVRVVIDSGLARVARYDPDRGLDELRLESISRFSSVQRQGRAGRQAPGTCYRLDGKLVDQRRAEALDGEIRRCDLAPLAIALKKLHGGDLRSFRFFEAPEPERILAAEQLLADLGYTAGLHQPLTGLGKLLAELPVHPRQGRLLLEAARRGVPELGARAAALLAERDILRPDRHRRATPGQADLVERLEQFDAAERRGAIRSRPDLDAGALRQVSLATAQLRRLATDLPQGAAPADPLTALPALLLAAYPDRVGRRQVGDVNRATLVGGQGVAIGQDSCLHAGSGRERSAAPLLVAHHLHGASGPSGSRVFLQQGCEISEELLAAVFGPGCITAGEQLRYDAERGAVVAARVRRYRDLTLHYQEGIEADPVAVAACLAEALAPEAEAVLRADERCAALLDRWRWLATTVAESGLTALPDAAALRQVLAEACVGERRRDAVLAKDKLPLLLGRLEWTARSRLDEWAPDRLTVPSGSAIRLDYSGPRPVLAVRVQELYGLPATPRLAGGRVPVLLHLLAPNFRPVQITDDLASFWASTYVQVRKDLRGRYPKHAWPDDPLTAPAECKGGQAHG